jgi:uncharacterized protein YbjT (DUF2867 family)
VAQAALSACDSAIAKDHTLELVGPASVPERDILERAARLLGRPIRIVATPVWTVRLALAILRRAGGQGLSPDALEVLTTDTTLDPGPAARALGLTLTSLDDMIHDSVQL